MTVRAGMAAMRNGARRGKHARRVLLIPVAALLLAAPAWTIGLRDVRLPFGLGRARPVYSISVPVPPRTPRTVAAVPVGPADRPLVVIDAGHGGADPGAINPESGLREKDVTLRIAAAIRDDLVASGRARVVLTRDDDRYLLHRERFEIARRLKADLFISIHCDSVASHDSADRATGASAYTLSEVASDKEAARLAQRENRPDAIAGVDLSNAGYASSILIDLAQRETMNGSAQFARLLGREARSNIATRPTFHRMASLLVLKAPDTPSVLFETGYLSNNTEAAFLDSADGRQKIARSVRGAIDAFFARRSSQG